MAQALDGKMRPMEAQPLEKEVEWLREMLGNAQKEIAALNQSAAEARADRADELLRALLAAKSEAEEQAAEAEGESAAEEPTPATPAPKKAKRRAPAGGARKARKTSAAAEFVD